MIKNTALLIILSGWLICSVPAAPGNVLSAQTTEPPAAITLRNIDNQVFTASDFRIDEQGFCILRSAGGEKSLNRRDLLEMEFSGNTPIIPAFSAGRYEIILNNNDVIYGEIKGGQSNLLTIHSEIWGELKIKFEYLSAIRLKNQSSKNRLSFSKTRAEDVIYLLNGDRDAGIVTAVRPDGLTLKSSLYGKERSYQFSNIWWVEFAQLAEPPVITDESTAVLICRDNSKLTVQVQKAAERIFHCKFLSADGKQEYRIPFENLSGLYFKNERCVYLSDLEPTDLKEYPSILSGGPPADSIPFLWPYQKDAGVYHRRTISLKNKKYYKGLGVHANSELTYALNGQYRKFFATAGLDDESGPGGSVNFIVYLDGKKSYESGLVKWGDEPKEIALDITGTKEIRLVVNDGGDYYVLDRAAWAGARLIK